MSRLPVVSGDEVVFALAKLGYLLDRQRGSHMMLRQTVEPFRRVTVPNHKTVSKGHCARSFDWSV